MNENPKCQKTTAKTLIKLLEDANTLQEAFQVLKNRGLKFNIEVLGEDRATNVREGVKVAKRDYLVFETNSYTNGLRLVLHPYGSTLTYVPQVDLPEIDSEEN